MKPLLFAALACTACWAQSPATTLIFENVTVIDATGAPAQPHSIVVVQDRKITGVKKKTACVRRCERRQKS
jgi:hypothetical protein